MYSSPSALPQTTAGTNTNSQPYSSTRIFALMAAAVLCAPTAANAIHLTSQTTTEIASLKTAPLLFKRAGPTTSNCMVLTNSVTCPAQNGLVIAQTSAYRDTASFDAFVNSRLDTNAAYVKAFQDNFGCPEYKGQGQQFHMSIFCALLTQKPTGCSQQDSQQRVPLCQDTCNSAVSSLSSFYQTVCLSNQTVSAFAERNLTISAYQGFCSELTVKNSQSNQCLNGSTQPQEANTCGFSSVDQARTFCSSSQNSCCQSVPGANQPSTTTSPSGSATNPTSPTSSATSADSNSGSSGFSSSIIFIILLALGILFFLIMLFLFFRWAMARRQDEDEEDEAPLSPEMPVMAQRPMSNAESSKYGSSIPGPLFASNLPGSGVFDENFSIVQVIAPYESQMVDELSLNVNDQIQVLESYDDGWAYGKKMATGEVGTFPLVCTAPLGGGGDGGASRESYAQSSQLQSTSSYRQSSQLQSTSSYRQSSQLQSTSSYRQSSQFSVSNYASQVPASNNLSQFTGNSAIPSQRSSYMPEQDGLDSADAAFSS